jgi:hypothetical protein
VGAAKTAALAKNAKNAKQAISPSVDAIDGSGNPDLVEGVFRGRFAKNHRISLPSLPPRSTRTFLLSLALLASWREHLRVFQEMKRGLHRHRWSIDLMRLVITVSKNQRILLRGHRNGDADATRQVALTCTINA